jgi:hypothetical protein
MFDVNFIILMQVTGRRERIRKQLLDEVKTKRRYWNVEQKGLGRTVDNLFLKCVTEYIVK